MYVESVPNRNSPPAILLREASRVDGMIVKRTLANLSSWPAAQIDALRRVLKRESLVSPADAFQILRASPHGHVAAALGTLRRLGLEPILSRSRGPERDLVVAMIVARILEPASKLATARGFHPETATSSLPAVLGLDEAIDEVQLYRSLDWLLERQQSIENALAKRHLVEGSVILYDVSSTYFEGRHCPLARFGHSRDERSGNLQIVFGLLTNSGGCPVAVEVFEGNTGDPTTVASQVSKLRERFHLKQIVLVGDRGMLTSARIREDLKPQEGLPWISALKSVQIQQLVQSGALQLSLFEQHDLGEILHASYPGERLIACRNPLLAEERSRKRNELLEATEKQLKRIVEATQRKKKPLRGRKEIGLAVGKILGRFKMGKHFSLFIEEVGFRCERKQANIEREAALDLLRDLATLTRNEVRVGEQTVSMLATPTPVQQRALQLLQVSAGL